MDKETIFTSKDSDGNRYLSLFLQDYKQAFPDVRVIAGCRGCLEEYYRKYIKHIPIMKVIKNSGYVLKKKYNGIPLKFGSQIYVSNANLTDDLAKELLKRKNGKDLFEKMPEASQESKDTDEEE